MKACLTKCNCKMWLPAAIVFAYGFLVILMNLVAKFPDFLAGIIIALFVTPWMYLSAPFSFMLNGDKWVHVDIWHIPGVLGFFGIVLGYTVIVALITGALMCTKAKYCKKSAPKAASKKKK